MACNACGFCDDVCGCDACMQKPKTQKPNELTLCQVGRHCGSQSCWLVAHGVVYDATSFIPDHPAGSWPILQRAGKDCTVDYDFHSEWSKDTRWRPLRIGHIVRCKSEPEEKSFCLIS